jgi:hypothetical protein
MASVSFGNSRAEDGVISFENAQQDLHLEFDADPRHLHTVMIVDNSLNPSLIHFLVVNIPGNNVSQGQVVIPYIPPSPPSGVHQYSVDIFQQPEVFQPQKVTRKMDVEEFVDRNQLRPLYHTDFQVAAQGNNLMKFQSTGQTPSRSHSHSHKARGPYPPSEEQVKYCDCVLDVEARGGAYNPYAVCAKSTGTTYRWCSDQVYDFPAMSLQDLQSYAALHNLPTAGTREEVLARINEMKAREGKMAQPQVQLAEQVSQLPRSSPQIQQLPQQLGQSFQQIPQQLSQTFQQIPQQLGQEFQQHFGQSFQQIPQQLGQTVQNWTQQFGQSLQNIPSELGQMVRQFV